MEQEYLISLSDLFALFKRAKKMIVFVVVVFACIGAFFALTKPVLYMAEGSFRDKGLSEAGGNDTSLKLFGIEDNKEKDALVWMRSRTLIEQLVLREGLQANIVEKRPSFPLLARMRDNLIVEYALWNKKKSPSLSPKEKKVQVEKVIYPREYPLSLSVTFDKGGVYKVVDQKKRLLGSGLLNHPFEAEDFSFTLSGSDCKGDYQLTLWPLQSVVEDMSKKIVVTTDSKDNTLYQISCLDTDRHLASRYINSLMGIYVEHIQREHAHFLKEQLSYLENRQNEMTENLRSVLEEHVTNVSTDLITSGFTNSQSAIEFLGGTSQGYTRALYGIDLEIKRLKNFRESGYAYHDRYRSEDDPFTINKVLGKIRVLKQQADSIELSLKSDGTSINELNEETFAKLFDDYHESRVFAKEVKEILELIRQNRPIKRDYLLFNEPKFYVGAWFTRLQEIKTRSFVASSDKRFVPHQSEEYQFCLSQFEAYLMNLEHLFNVEEKALKEKLVHQQNLPVEIQGITLKSAQDLYVGACRALSEVEAMRVQYEYVVEQMNDPDFEITSLSTVLSDPVSRKLIESASSIVLSLKDASNRSAKEQERLKDQLTVERGFLSVHVRQTLQLAKIREALFRDKIRAIQQATLGLNQRQVSLLEKHLEDFITTRLGNLEQEKQLIGQYQEALNEEVAQIPSKWVSERIVEQHMSLNHQLMAEATKLVESKNISANLEIVRSSPVDLAVPPMHPKSPRILLFTLLGAFVGAFFICAYVFGRSILFGLEASVDNLRLAKQHVSGTLSSKLSQPWADSDLETMRALSSYFGANQDMLLLLGKGPNYALDLAKLISLTGSSVLILPLSFDQKAKEGDGLLPYLEGKCAFPTIHKAHSFDQIEPGGISRFSTELIGSKRFAKLYQQLSEKYDCILCTSTALPTSAEAVALQTQFSNIAISIQREKIEDLHVWMNKNVTFLQIL